MFLSVLTVTAPMAAELSTATSTIQEYNQDGSPLGSPGITGFLVTMVLGIVIILLGLDLTRRQRRLRYRVDYAKAREAEAKQQSAEKTPSQSASKAPSSVEADHPSEQAKQAPSRKADSR